MESASGARAFKFLIPFPKAQFDTEIAPHVLDVAKLAVTFILKLNLFLGIDCVRLAIAGGLRVVLSDLVAATAGRAMPRGFGLRPGCVPKVPAQWPAFQRHRTHHPHRRQHTLASGRTAEMYVHGWCRGERIICRFCDVGYLWWVPKRLRHIPRSLRIFHHLLRGGGEYNRGTFYTQSIRIWLQQFLGAYMGAVTVSWWLSP